MASKTVDKQHESSDSSCTWEAAAVICEQLQLQKWVVSNTLELLDQDHTVPFIARYRKEKTNNMEADKIREVQQLHHELKAVQTKVATVIKAIDKLGKMSKQLSSALRASQNLNEVEHLYAPYKSGSKRTLAERARELGLEPLALKLLSNPREANLNSAVKPGQDGVTSLAEVEKGVQHIIADIIAKDKEVMDTVRDLCQNSYVTLESTKSRTAAKKEKETSGSSKSSKKDNGGHGKLSDQNNIAKFELYFSFSGNVKYIKPHQVLAINRGENLKILSVKVNIPDKVKNNLTYLCNRKWMHPSGNAYTQKIVKDSFEDAYKRLIEPLMVRQFRADLTKKAEKASVEVFAANLKRLLLTPPVRGKVVLGIDPGFRNGCKFAVTSATGKILDTGVSHLHDKRGNFKEVEKIKRIIHNYRCETVAIGNGTACRETESVLSNLIKNKAFHPFNVMYCIVSESGASIYSASDEAKKEMPDLDVTLRGAVSIARRLQDPLAELVKIEPKHIGVGMYQHDISESQLKSALDGVVEECVSFVGVDINVCGEALLRRVAGLNSARAKKILEWRDSQGPLMNRDQLRTIKGLGPKSFEQCAGFIRVLPESSADHNTTSKAETADSAETSSGKGRKRKAAAPKATSKKAKKEVSSAPNSMDMTCIHPESYDLAERFLSQCGANKENIGQPGFIQKVQNYTKMNSVSSIAEDMGTGEPTMQLIVQGLQQPLGHDIREEFEKPLFKQGVRSLGDLKVGTPLTGRVTNTTHFGAFVDVGVGRDGLIHVSKMNPASLGGRKALQLGDKVEVTVDNIDLSKNRLGMKLIKVL